MRKLLTFIALLSHMNFSMFMPQIPEQDIFDEFGKQLDDINSLAEFISQIVLGNHDDTPEDGDDDNGQQFLFTKITDLFANQYFNLESPIGYFKKDNSFPKFIASFLTTEAYDIVSPPPKA